MYKIQKKPRSKNAVVGRGVSKRSKKHAEWIVTDRKDVSEPRLIQGISVPGSSSGYCATPKFSNYAIPRKSSNSLSKTSSIRVGGVKSVTPDVGVGSVAAVAAPRHPSDPDRPVGETKSPDFFVITSCGRMPIIFDDLVDKIYGFLRSRYGVVQPESTTYTNLRNHLRCDLGFTEKDFPQNKTELLIKMRRFNPPGSAPPSSPDIGKYNFSEPNKIVQSGTSSVTQIGAAEVDVTPNLDSNVPTNSSEEHSAGDLDRSRKVDSPGDLLEDELRKTMKRLPGMHRRMKRCGALATKVLNVARRFNPDETARQELIRSLLANLDDTFAKRSPPNQPAGSVSHQAIPFSFASLRDSLLNVVESDFMRTTPMQPRVDALLKNGSSVVDCTKPIKKRHNYAQTM